MTNGDHEGQIFLSHPMDSFSCSHLNFAFLFYIYFFKKAPISSSLRWYNVMTLLLHEWRHLTSQFMLDTANNSLTGKVKELSWLQGCVLISRQNSPRSRIFRFFWLDNTSHWMFKNVFQFYPKQLSVEHIENHCVWCLNSNYMEYM